MALGIPVLLGVCIGGFFVVPRILPNLGRPRAQHAVEGFTLIDFLVTFVIGAILVAITITMIQMVVNR
jgi:hypothetical protein